MNGTGKCTDRRSGLSRTARRREMTRALLPKKAAVSACVGKQLGTERKLFGTVSRGGDERVAPPTGRETGEGPELTAPSGRNLDLFGDEEGNAQAQQTARDKLLHDQLTAQLKSGGQARPGACRRPWLARRRGRNDWSSKQIPDTPRGGSRAPPANSPPPPSHRSGWGRCPPAPPPGRRCRPEFRWEFAR